MGKANGVQIQELVEAAALKGQLRLLTQQNQGLVNTLVRYSEALGRLMTLSKLVVDSCAEFEDGEGESLEVFTARVRDLRTAVYDLLPKEKRGEQEAAEDGGTAEDRADGSTGDGVQDGEAREGAPAPGGEGAEGAGAPAEDAPAREE